MRRTGSRVSLSSVLLVYALVATGCATTTPTGSPAPAEPSASASRSPQLPFEPSAYPPDGGSACRGDGYLGSIGAIRALAERTVEFSLCGTDVSFLSKIASISLAIHDADYLARTGGGGAILREPNGTGPYRVRAWHPGSDIELETHADYWGDPPRTPNAIVRWDDSPAFRLLELVSETVDGISEPPAADLASVASDPDLVLHLRSTLSVSYLGINSSIAPFDDPRVRRAIGMGIDRQRIIDEAYRPGTTVATHFAPCGVPGGCGGLDWHGFDPFAARELLADAGLDGGFATTLSLTANGHGSMADPRDVAAGIQGQLLEYLGISAEIEIRDEARFGEALERGSVEGMHLAVWNGAYPDPSAYLDKFLGTERSPRLGAISEDLARAVDEASRTVEPTARERLLAVANDDFLDQVPMIPLGWGGTATAFRADVEGSHGSPVGAETLFTMQAADRSQIVWLQSGEPASLYCPDETDIAALRVCTQIFEPLYSFESGTAEPIPRIAEGCRPNEDATIWTCTLRVATFHQGGLLDANDVVATFAVQWDAAHPLHVGRSGLFENWANLFGDHLNRSGG